jgi:hypothetical protein
MYTIKARNKVSELAITIMLFFFFKEAKQNRTTIDYEQNHEKKTKVVNTIVQLSVAPFCMVNWYTNSYGNPTPYLTHSTFAV